MESSEDQLDRFFSNDSNVGLNGYGTIPRVAPSQREVSEGMKLSLGSEDDDSSSDESDAAYVPLDEELPFLSICCVLSSSFSYGCVLTTLFLLTLPIECERINLSNGTPKSIALGIFVAIAGFTQLVSPFIGRVSDTYEPPTIPGSVGVAEIGQRLPYYIFGAFVATMGLICQMLSSYAALWLRYTFAFFFSVTGLNIQYAMMMALFPDHIPQSQTGIANGILALLLVTGSLLGFGLFHTLLSENIASMYALYASIVIVTSCLTCTHAHDRDAQLSRIRMKRQSLLRESQHTRGSHHDGEDESCSQCSTAVGTTASPTTVKQWRRRADRVTKKAFRKAKRVTKQAIAKAKEIALSPTLIANSMVRPIRLLKCSSLLACYTIDPRKHHDFFVVTVSRLFYYCGMSVQTFFLYFVHDIIGVRTNPEAAVATLAIIGQCAGALTCYPVGVLSDHVFNSQRRPFVLVSCSVLASATLLLALATTMHEMTIFCIILGAANGMYLTMETSLAVDALQSSDFAHSEGSAQLLGIWGVAAFLGSALGPMIGGPLLFFVGSNGSGETMSSESDPATEEYSLSGYVVVLALSSFYFVCSAVSLLFMNQRQL